MIREVFLGGGSEKLCQGPGKNLTARAGSHKGAPIRVASIRVKLTLYWRGPWYERWSSTMPLRGTPREQDLFEVGNNMKNLIFLDSPVGAFPYMDNVSKRHDCYLKAKQRSFVVIAGISKICWETFWELFRNDYDSESLLGTHQLRHFSVDNFVWPENLLGIRAASSDCSVASKKNSLSFGSSKVTGGHQRIVFWRF